MAKRCPRYEFTNCIEEECAEYDEDNRCCSSVTIAIALLGINLKMDGLMSELHIIGNQLHLIAAGTGTY